MDHPKQKTTITIESYQRTVSYARRVALTVWCDHCEAKTLMIAPDEAIALFQITAREIFRRVEAGKVHFFETEKGELFVCGNSLSTQNKRNKKEKKWLQ
jgi:hypothetical protein